MKLGAGKAINRIIITFFLILCCTISAYAQDEELLSAKDLLGKFSDNFRKNIQDYEGDILWTQGETVNKGRVQFKNPQKVKIVFSEPNKQEICSNGYDLWVYIDYLRIVLRQQILEKEKKKTADGKTATIINPILINPMGYDKFLTNYSIEFYGSKNKTDYKDGKKVYQMKLVRWRSSKNGFNVVYLTIEENGLIRRVEGITAAYKKIILEIDNIKTNVGISDLVFDYELPAGANVVDNFISKPEEQ